MSYSSDDDSVALECLTGLASNSSTTTEEDVGSLPFVVTNKHIRKKTTNVSLVDLAVNPASPFGVEDAISCDPKLKPLFKKIVRFKGNLNAAFLIVLDSPTFADAQHDPPTLDHQGKIYNAFNSVIHNFYTETFTVNGVPKRRNPAYYSTALVSLCPGHPCDKFYKGPNAVEVGASAPHLRNIILNMPNLRLVYVLGKHAEELFVHNLDPHVMYGIAPHIPFHVHHQPSPTMAARKSHGVYGNAYIGGIASFRYYPLPWVTHRDFDNMLIASLFRIEDSRSPLIKYPVDPTPYHISDPPLLAAHEVPHCHTFHSFKQHIHSLLEKKTQLSLADDASLSSLSSLSSLDDKTQLNLVEDACFSSSNDDEDDKTQPNLVDDACFSSYNDKTQLSLVDDACFSSSNDDENDEDAEEQPCLVDDEDLFDDEVCAAAAVLENKDAVTSRGDAAPELTDDGDSTKKATFPQGGTPVDMMVNAATEPYLLYPPQKPMYFCVRNIRYDNIRNIINLYCSTPASTSVLLSVQNPVFSFYVSTHPSFRDPNDNAREVFTCDKDLNHLRTFVNKKLYYKKNEHPFFLKNIAGQSPFTLELVHDKHDDSDGYWHEKTFKYIKITVSHHVFIEHILAIFKKMISDENIKTKSVFKSFCLATPERMFTINHRVYMSTWHRFTSVHFAPPECISGHARLLNASVDLANTGTSVQFLKFADAIPLYDPDDPITDMADIAKNPTFLVNHFRPLPRLTSGDVPADIRASFDIETWFERGVKEFDNTPVICICLTVRKHSDHTTTFDNKEVKGGPPPTFTPTDGYHYFTFMMGKTAPPNKHTSELLGPEFLFEFACERELLSSYFYFKHLLFPTYIQGHNSKGFDEVKLFTRARMIGAEIAPQGWRSDQQTRLTIKKFQSIAKGERRQYFAEGQEGVCHVDTLQVSMNELNRGSYQLSSLAADFVGMTKHDMPYDAIKGHWIKGPETRRTLVDYCIRDAQLPDQINTKRQTISSLTQLSRVVTNVPEERIHDEGMQIKVFGAIMYTNAEFGNHALMQTNKHWMEEISAIDTGPICDDGREEVEELVTKLYNLADPTAKKKSNLTDYFSPRSSGGLLDSGDHPDSSSPSTELIQDEFADIVYSKPGADLNPKSRSRDNRTIDQKRSAVENALAASKAASGSAGLRRTAEYAGATVMKAHRGWYREVPLMGVDFASLYPSVIIANNISRNTQVFEDEMAERSVTKDMCLPPPPELAITNPRTGKKSQVYYLKPEYRVGLVARTEIELLKRRNAVKRLIDFHGMEFESDGETQNPHYNKNKSDNALQLSNSLKLCANSCYGQFGTKTQNGNMACAASVTCYGRHYIGISKDTCEKRWGGYVAGGDTDSIFVGFEGQKIYNTAPDGTVTEEIINRYETTVEVEDFAQNVVIPELNKLFPSPVKLDFEKCMVYFVAVAKKRYIYWLCNKGQVPRLNYKGLEIVRRDSLPFTKQTMLDSLKILQEWPAKKLTREEDKIWITERKETAVNYIKSRARTMLSGDMSIGDLKLSKSISREYYANRKQEHLSVVDKLTKRGLEAPGIGERAYFVYAKVPLPEGVKENGIKGYMIAEDPEYVIRNGIPIDYEYYFEHKFVQPIVSIMVHFLMDDMIDRFTRRNPHRTTPPTHNELQAETTAFLFGDIYPKILGTKRTALLSSDRTITSFASKDNSMAEFVPQASRPKKTLDDRKNRRCIFDKKPKATPTRKRTVEDAVRKPLNAAKKRAPLHTEPQTEEEKKLAESLKNFTSLENSGGRKKITISKQDTFNTSSIFSYFTKERSVTVTGRSREHIKLEYQDKIAAAEREAQQKKKAMDEIHVGCRKCLKISPTDPVACRAVTCKVYGPRVESEFVYESASKHHDTLVNELAQVMQELDLDLDLDLDLHQDPKKQQR